MKDVFSNVKAMKYIYLDFWGWSDNPNFIWTFCFIGFSNGVYLF